MNEPTTRKFEYTINMHPTAEMQLVKKNYKAYFDNDQRTS